MKRPSSRAPWSTSLERQARLESVLSRRPGLSAGVFLVTCGGRIARSRSRYAVLPEKAAGQKTDPRKGRSEAHSIRELAGSSSTDNGERRILGRDRRDSHMDRVPQ